MIGGPRLLTRSMSKMNKIYRSHATRILDVCHGEGKMLEGSVTARRLMSLGRSGRVGAEDTAQDSWIVAYAIQYTNSSTGASSTMIEVERYIKQGGRWLFLSREKSIPTTGPFEDFVHRYCADEEDLGTDYSGLDGSDSADEASPFGDAWRKKAGKRSDGSDWTYLFELVCYRLSSSPQPLPLTCN